MAAPRYSEALVTAKEANLIHRDENNSNDSPSIAQNHTAYIMQCSLKRRGYSEFEILEPVQCPLE